MSEFSWEADIMPVTEQYARRQFRRHPQCEELVNDAISSAWELFQSPAAQDAATPKSLAVFAVKRVKAGRHFSESARSITGPNPRGLAKPERSVFEPQAVFRLGDDPSRIVAFRDFFWAWFAGLSHRKQHAVELLASGETTEATAAMCGCTPGRISQIRRELAERWADLEKETT